MVKKLIFKTIRFYQIFISPVLGQHCRFYPTCSQYSFQAIEKYGIVKGGWKGLKRILRCSSWNSGGIDMP